MTKQNLSQIVPIPSGIECTYKEDILKCKKDQLELEKRLYAPTINLKISDKEVAIKCKKGNKKDYKKLMTFQSHIKNIFRGLTENFAYHLEICNVHFPMTVKVEKDKLAINNFLGEKVPRFAQILPNVEVKVQGNKIIVSSHDKEAAGQTVSNIEQATKVKDRDRRIYQDGIHLVSKPGRKL